MRTSWWKGTRPRTARVGPPTGCRPRVRRARSRSAFPIRSRTWCPFRGRGRKGTARARPGFCPSPGSRTTRCERSRGVCRLARRAERGRGGWRLHARAVACRHGMDGRRGPQPLRASRRRRLSRCGVARSGPWRGRRCGTRTGCSRAGEVRVRLRGRGQQAAAAGEALYRNEPVARAVFDRCDAVLREERGASLLGWMSGESGPERTLGDPALYALQCALTALWVERRRPAGRGRRVRRRRARRGPCGRGAGPRGRASPGRGAGRAGGRVVGGGGHRHRGRAISTRPSAGIELRSPAIAFVSGATGRVVGSGEMRETLGGLRPGREPAAHGRCFRTVAERGVEVVVEIGPRGSVGPLVAFRLAASRGRRRGRRERRPAGRWCCPGPGPADGDGSAPNGDAGFARAVAGAYEAGLPVAFAGLFAGEVRRRISVPG